MPVTTHNFICRTPMHLKHFKIPFASFFSGNPFQSNLKKLTTRCCLIKFILACAICAGLPGRSSAQAGPNPVPPVLQHIQTVFVIAMENHNFTQPNPASIPQQILGNPAAPYLNSLITPGNPNAAQVSFATRYFNSAIGVHPSQPNYIWAEAGTDFGIQTDADPSMNTGNLFNAPHLTAQLNTAGIPWMNYQEDVQFTASPTISSAGMSATNVNAYYGSGQYFYAAKHNPMVFFADTQNQNVYPLANLLNDLANDAVGSYNWITPNIFNDQHNALSGGFVYQGVGYAGDQAAVAQGDNFLATLIPQIMASPAYQSNGVIIIRWDETEGGDSAAFTIPEIIISPLAKGNAYACNVPLSHSSDVKTMEEIFGLPWLANPIPSYETSVSAAGCNNVATVNDLSDMFAVAVTVPVTPVTTNNPTTTNGNPVISSGQMMPGSSGFQLTFSGPASQTYEILATDDLTLPRSAWSVLANGLFTGTNITFADLDASNHASRFYVIKSP
jgi:hypothetical protein